MQNSQFLLNIRKAATDEARAKAVAAFDDARLASVVTARRSKPFFLPAQFNSTAVPVNASITATTDESVDHDVDIVGGITDIINRDVQIQDVGRKQTWADKHVNIEALFGFGGNNANTTGKMGVFNYPTPFPLQANNQLEVMVKNVTGAAANIIGYTCFTCQRVFPENSVEGSISSTRLEGIKRHIAKNPYPRPIVLRANVVFDAASANGKHLNVQTDKLDFPVLITGAYGNNVFRSTVQVTDQDGYQFSRSRFPTWALFARRGWIGQQFNYFRPFLLPAQGRLTHDFYNGYDSTNFDPVQDGATGVYPHIEYVGWVV